MSFRKIVVRTSKLDVGREVSCRLTGGRRSWGAYGVVVEAGFLTMVGLVESWEEESRWERVFCGPVVYQGFGFPRQQFVPIRIFVQKNDSGSSTPGATGYRAKNRALHGLYFFAAHEYDMR